MKGTEVYDLIGGAASESSAKLNTIFLETYYKEVDDMFGRLHFADKKGHFTPAAKAQRDQYLEIHRDLTNDEIKKRGLENEVYKRLEFKSRDDMKRFVTYLRDSSNGVPTEVIDRMAVAPVKIGRHGKWLMEIPERVYQRDGDGNVVKNAFGEDVTIDTNKFISAYQNKTGLDVKEYNYREDYGDADPASGGSGSYTQKTTADVIHGVFFNEITAGLGELGKVIRFADKIERFQSTRGDMNQEHALTASVKHDEHGRIKGGYWTGATRGVKPVKVFGDTVIMDGKDITNTRLGKRVLRMHEQRTHMAEKYLTSKLSVRNNINDKMHEKVNDSSMSYNMKFFANRAVDALSGERVVRMKANAQAIHDAAEHQTYASGKLESGRFTGKVLNDMRDSFGEQAILLRQASKDVTITEDLMNALTKVQIASSSYNLTKAQIEFIDEVREKFNRALGEAASTAVSTIGEAVTTASGNNDEKSAKISFSNDDRITMTDIVESVQREHSTGANHASLDSDEAKEILEANKRSSDGGQFRYSEEELKLIGLNIGTKHQFDAIREDFGIDLNFEKHFGEKMSAIQLTHISPNLQPLMAMSGITYSEASGKFTDCSGRELNKKEVLSALHNVRKNMLASADMEIMDGTFTKHGIALDRRQAITELQAINQANNNALLGKGVEFDGTYYKKGTHILSEEEVFDMFSSRLGRLDKNGNHLANKLDKMAKVAGYEATDSGLFRHAHKADISTADILKLDKAFLSKAEKAGFNFITAAGTFDVKALKELKGNTEALKKIGISSATHSTLCQLHGQDGNALQQFLHRGSKAWGNHNHMLTKRLFKGTTGIVGKGLNVSAGGSKLVDEGDEEAAQFMQMTNSYTKGYHHVKQAGAYVKQYTNAARMRYDAWKTKRGTNNNRFKDKNAKNKAGKKNRAEKRKLNPQASEKYLKRQEKRRKRTEKSEKRWAKIDGFTSKFNVKQRAKEWIANTKIGKAVIKVFNKIKLFLIKIVAYFLAGYFMLGGVIICAIAVLSMIQALLNGAYDGLKDVWVKFSGEERPAAIVLYQYMNDDLQEPWLNNLRKYQNMYENRESIKYTINYDDFTSYISEISTLQSKDNSLYVNPFPYVGDSVPTENLTLIEGYDGASDTTVIANPSVYGEKDNATGYVSTESGHTNNIKDILAMVDVMYQFEFEKFGETELTNVLGEAPAGIDFDNFWNKAAGWFKWAGDAILSLFDSDDDPPKLEDYWGGSVSYATIQNYCTQLWEASHQEQVNLDVHFYPMKELDVNIDGNIEDASEWLSAANASRLGICNNPVKSDFKIAYNYNGNRIFPYLLDASGNKVDLSSYDNGEGIRISMDGTHGRYFDDDGCLWNGMAEDRATYDEIKSNNCWEKTREEKDYTSYSATSEWKESEEEAENEAYTKVHDKSEYYRANPPSVPKEFTLGAVDRNAFTRIWKEGCFENSQKDGETQTKEIKVGTEKKQYYWSGDLASGDLGLTGDDEGGRPAYKIIIYKNGEEVFWDNTSWEDVIGTESYNDGAGLRVKYWYGSEVRKYDLGEGEYTYGWTFVPYEYDEDIFKTLYKVSWKADVVVQNTEVYNRECTGHTFKYCGGHVGCHVKGCVYSTTNEQLALAGMYKSQDIYPLARGFDLKANGYDKIRGKIIKKEIDYRGNAKSTSTSGGCPSPLEDVQGSDVNRGLNIYVVGEETLGKGINIRNDVPVQTIRDIFDVDCMLDKGSNVFPWKAPSLGGKGYKEYEGWTADNITFVAMRVSVDWNDLYGFDIPTELGSVSLSENDIKFLTEALALEYGDGFTETRKNAVDFALHWVSRGHYSQEHKDHDFLSETCKAHTISRSYGGVTYDISYDANCTAANSRGFVNFYLKQFGKASTDFGYDGMWNPLSEYSVMKPADIFYRKRETSYTAYEFHESDTANSADALTDALCEFRDNDNYGIYIGTLTQVFENDSITVPKGIEIDENSITLTNGYKIYKDFPITLDLSPEPRTGSMFGLKGNTGAGTVRLRTLKSLGYGQTSAEENFYWFLNPDSRTYYRSFED